MVLGNSVGGFGGDDILVALLAYVGVTDMQLDADLRRLIAIALARLLPDAFQWIGDRALGANLLRLIQVMGNLDARKVFRDRLASAGVLSRLSITLLQRLKPLMSQARIFSAVYRLLVNKKQVLLKGSFCITSRAMAASPLRPVAYRSAARCR